MGGGASWGCRSGWCAACTKRSHFRVTRPEVEPPNVVMALMCHQMGPHRRVSVAFDVCVGTFPPPRKQNLRSSAIFRKEDTRELDLSMTPPVIDAKGHVTRDGSHRPLAFERTDATSAFWPPPPPQNQSVRSRRGHSAT